MEFNANCASLLGQRNSMYGVLSNSNQIVINHSTSGSRISSITAQEFLKSKSSLFNRKAFAPLTMLP
jgi:hypothetical protein